MNHVAYLTGMDDLANSLPDRQESRPERLHHEYVVFTTQLKQVLCRSGVDREWLFHEHMLSVPGAKSREEHTN